MPPSLLGREIAFEAAEPLDDMGCFKDVDTRDHEWNSNVHVEHVVALQS